MPTETLREFIEDRLLAADPTIDLSEGSPYRVQVVDPLVRRFTPDPFEMDVDKFIETRLRQEYPDMDIREGSSVRDLLVKPSAVLLDPIQREVTLIKQNQSMIAPELLSPSEADALAANLLVRRSTGGLATGRVRMYFNAPVAVSVSLGNIFSTAGGLNFHPSSQQSISADAMLFNQDGNLYYFDVSVVAEKPGEDYNIDKEEIVSVTNLSTAVRVTNLAKFTQGIEEEDSEALIARAEESITVRDLVVPRGVSARLREQFADLTQLQVIGFRDDEMQRDLLTGGDLGKVLQSGVDGYTDDDGDGDDTTTVFGTLHGNFLIGGGGIFEAVGRVENYYLTASEIISGSGGYFQAANLWRFKTPVTAPPFKRSDEGLAIVKMGSSQAANNGVAKIVTYIGPHEVQLNISGQVASDVCWVLVRPEEDYEIESILTSTTLRVTTTKELPASMGMFNWAIRRKVLTISDIPGGILLPSAAGTIEIQSDRVHIGGCSDFYVRGSSLEDAELVIEAISDEAPLVDRLTLSTVAGSEWVTDAGVPDWVAAGAKPGFSLIIDAGPNAATYTILKIDPALPHRLQIYPAPTSTMAEQRYRIIDDIDMNLRAPRTMRGSGSDLETSQLSDVVTTSSAIDFSSLGGAEGDTLRIKGGHSKGDYIINAITGTGNRDLRLSGQMKATESNLSWELFFQQAGLNFPLIRIKSIDILDSNKQQTGDTIPYADPVDIRTYQFSNSGKGTKIAITDAITGIVGTVDLAAATYPLATCVLSLSVNSVPYTVTLTGAVSSTDVVNRINTVVPNIAALLEVAGEERLTLRSTSRWIRVAAGADNAVVGLDITGEDNRQIKSKSYVQDWTSNAYDLRIKRDAVSINTGDNVGYFYLIAVNANKLLVVGVDETNGTVTFLQPNVDVSVSVGSRSYGKARLYFLAPTSCSVFGNWHPPLLSTSKAPANAAIEESGAAIVSDERPVTYFTVNVDGARLRFFPDPDLMHQVIPPVGSSIPNNLASVPPYLKTDSTPTSAPGRVSRDADIDFLLKEILPGDVVMITHQPIEGTSDLTLLTLPADLQNKTLVMSIGGSPLKTCTFSDQLASVDDIINEINDAFGLTIAHKEEVVSPAATFLRLEADVDFVLYGTGTANGVNSPPSSGTLLGLGSVTKNNQATAYLESGYQVTEVGSTAIVGVTGHYRLYTTPVAAVSAHSQHFKIYRPGMQRLHSTNMNNQTEIGLYYMDVELVSEGVGDQWNVPNGLQMTVKGHDSDGYRLSVEDKNFTFSEEETPWISFSRRLLLTGVTDSPDNATSLYGQNVQINYERSPLTEQIQSFASSELERVLTANILVRHLMPHFLNFDIEYRGGSSADVVEADILAYLESLGPEDRVEVSSLSDLVKRRGASYIKNPITLVAIAHDIDRAIRADRSQDHVSLSRIATFFPDVISVTREAPTVL